MLLTFTKFANLQSCFRRILDNVDKEMFLVNIFQAQMLTSILLFVLYPVSCKHSTCDSLIARL